MTREEALYCMKASSVLHSETCEECPLYGDTGVDYCFEGALDEAIKALEQEPCEDCVSRHAVKEQMIKYGFLAPDMTVTEFVEDLPPVMRGKDAGGARMTLIDGNRIVTVQLYDDQYEEFMEKKMSIIDCINSYTNEGVTEPYDPQESEQ